MSHQGGDGMDESDLALEAALGKIESDESSGSDRETEPAVSEPEGPVIVGASYQQPQQDEGGMEEGERQPHAMQIPRSRSQVTLQGIFMDYKLFTMFRRFLKDQCITRNLNFWLACNYYHQLPSGTAEYQDRLYKVAKAIYMKYIKMNAPQLVQVQPSTKRTIKSLLGLSTKTLSASLFKPAQDEVWDLMERNEMRQFLTSDVFGELFSEVEDDLSSELAFTAGPPMVHVPGSLQQSSSEDSVSVTSVSTDGGGSEMGGRSSRRQHLKPLQRHNRSCSDTEAKTHGAPHAKKDKPVSREDFVAMVSERLLAVQKDRDHMRKRAQEQARQQGRTYDEIMAVDWYDLPNTVKYIRFDVPGPRVDSLRVDNKRGYSHGISPSHSPSLAPYPNSNSKIHIDQLAQREIQDALKDLEITNQVNRSRRYASHPKLISAASSMLSYTSDSGVGDSVQWNTCSSMLANRSVQRYVEGQNQLLNRTSQRDIDAKAAAITLMNSSPHAEDLSHQVHHFSGRHRAAPHPLARNYTGAYSSDDNASFLTMTSESDLFIPRRYHPATYSESDEPHHFPRAPRQLSKPRRTGLRPPHSHQAPPIVEPSHTPTSHPQTPRPSAQKSGSGILVLYDLVDISAPATKRPPFAKKHPSSDVTLAEFKEKIFSRRGEYRFFFKTFCEEIDEEIMEEISDDETILPHFNGKIVARVETVA